VGGVRPEPELGDARTDDQRAGETDGALAGGGAGTETGREDHTTAERITATDDLADDVDSAGTGESDDDAQAASADAPRIHGQPGEAEDATGAGSPPRRTVQILDLPLHRVRRPADLLHLIASAAGIAVILILSVYAYSTTTGVTRDVQSALAQVVRSVVLVPVTVIEGLLILVLPVVVIVSQVIRRNLRGAGEAVIASAVAYLLATVAVLAVNEFATGTEVARSLVQWRSGEWVSTITPTVAALAGLLTAVGTRGRRRVVAISWNLLWVALGISIITGDQTLVGVLVTVLLGRIAGMGMRYASGVRSDRAYGTTLVQAIRRAGVDPLSIVRVGDATQDAFLQPQTASVPLDRHEPASRSLPARAGTSPGYGGSDDGGAAIVDGDGGRDGARASVGDEVPGRNGEPGPGQNADDATGDPRVVRKPRPDGEVRPPAHPTSATVAAERPGQNRVYAVIGTDGDRWDTVVLDADRQVIGVLASIWSVIRLRGLERRAAVSLRQAAERAALMYYAATAAGVNSPRLHGIAEADDSVLLVGEHIRGARSVLDLSASAVTDEVMVRAWEQLDTAHAAGLAHRNLSAETVLVATGGPEAGQVWLNGWEQGEIAASPLAQRVDRAQLLTAFALHTGVEQAMAAARRVLTPQQLAEVAPLLQTVAFPPSTRGAARANKDLIAALRSALLEYIPAGSGVEPIRLTRISVRTVVTLTIAVVAVWVLVTTLNFDQVQQVVLQANPAWMLIAFAAGLVSYIGAAVSLAAFSPEKLGLWRTLLVQVAASVLTLVAPAGLGPAALSVRYMQRRGIRTSLSLATVGLWQLAQFVATVLLVVTLALFLGTAGPLRQLPSLVIVITIAVVAAVAGLVLLVPPIRSWLARRLLPSWRQVWPRVVWVVGQPQRLAVGLTGALLVTVGYLAAFAATLHALGQSVPLTTLSIVYLTGNTVGSAVPTPGGIGTVELALSAGLRTAGLATAAAASVAVLFRVLTFWLRVPLGWAALRYLQRKEAL